MEININMNNNIVPEKIVFNDIYCDYISDKDVIKKQYYNYYSDESKLTGTPPKRIFFPKSTEEVAYVLKNLFDKNEKLTVSGARTGIVGGAVPVNSENVISLENLVFEFELKENLNNNYWFIHAGAGTILSDLHSSLKKKKLKYNGVNKIPQLIYPVDPTEQSASIGGNVATNASGARSFYYGPTRNWVVGLTVVLSDGKILKLKRGHVFAHKNTFILHDIDKFSTKTITIPNISTTKTKNVAGYFLADNMDVIDIFIGGEGTLGIITEVELRLCEKPKNIINTCIFFPKCDFISIIQDIKLSGNFCITAIEYMDNNSLNLLRNCKFEKSLKIPKIPEDAEGVLYLEINSDNNNDKVNIFDTLEKLMIKYDISNESTWVATNEHEILHMKKFRHALPERINSIISEIKNEFHEITKIATDMSVPENSIRKTIELYKSTLDAENLEYYIFGHIGDNHLHVNIIPHSMDEMLIAKRVYQSFAKKIVEMKGSVAAEHGIGKIKKKFLTIQYNSREIEIFKQFKKAFDKKNILNPHVLFD